MRGEARYFKLRRSMRRQRPKSLNLRGRSTINVKTTLGRYVLVSK